MIGRAVRLRARVQVTSIVTGGPGRIEPLGQGRVGDEAIEEGRPSQELALLLQFELRDILSGERSCHGLRTLHRSKSPRLAALPPVIDPWVSQPW